MAEFALHPRLAADTAFVIDWRLSRALLMNDSRFPWLILVPRRASLTELFDLDAEAQSLFVIETADASRRLKGWANADKMNVAALGNQVPQLHVHVIARRHGDVAWPNPPFGGVAVPYADGELKRIVGELKAVLQS